MARLGFLLRVTLISCLCTTLALAQLSSSYFSRNSTAKTWKNDDASFPDTTHFSDGSLARFILLEVIHNLYGFGLCFYCQPPTTYSCYLSIVFVAMEQRPVTVTPPLLVWSANRDQPVGENSVLCIDGDLELKDPNGQSIWSTGSASNSSVVGMNMTSLGNLVLLDRTNRTIWQSFDHPTDTLLLGQRLMKGQKLTSSMSSEDMGSGLFYLSLDSSRLSAYVLEQSQSHSTYLFVFPFILALKHRDGLACIEFGNGNISFLYEGERESLLPVETPASRYLQLLRLDVDGGLRIYSWEPGNGWLVIYYFSDAWDECQFPLKCGRYGLCRYGQCTCPVAPDGTRFFAPSDPQHPGQGCQDINVDDDGDDLYELRDFGRLSYYTYSNLNAATQGLETEESCKEACLRAGTACMAAFFMYVISSSRGYCYLVSHVLSITGAPKSDDFKTSAYIKVRVSSTKHGHSPTTLTALPVALAVCAFVLLCICVSLLDRRKRIRRERDYLKTLSETLLRFSYSDLSTATQNFSQKVGGGGFGLVFKGTLPDGREVAVKRLGNDGQGKKEFLAEVETLGKIHHFNLVRLLGFCFEDKHLILVYEYMTNGSLEKWIFSDNQISCLDWEQRKKIVMGIAKGLAYIHEECVQRIAHLDVKPHNILLDDNFNAKVSDFGMSKLIDRDESQVMTGMRGTLGYLAPEWQGSRITVKADVYSFGILVLEVVSGRKVLDYSQPESDVQLLKLLKKKSLENRLRDIVDSRCEDMVSNSEDAELMIRLAMWCLHSDYKRRPVMSSVVKVLEGSLELEPHFTYNFSSIFSPPCPHSNATASLASNVKPL